jgi:CRP-like cAMP-binding protein
MRLSMLSLLLLMYHVLGKGDIFGEAALLDGSPRTADAVAVADCELYVLHRRDFMLLMMVLAMNTPSSRC